MMKKLAVALLTLCLLLSAALADGPVLLVELPEDAQMIESVEFDDGDFIQTYQLAEGVQVQILRYASFDLTLDDLAEGEWNGFASAEKLALEAIGDCPAQGMRLTYAQEGEQVEVYMIIAEAQGQTLLFEAVFPSSLGDEAIEAYMNGWLGTMTVSGAENAEVG